MFVLNRYLKILTVLVISLFVYACDNPKLDPIPKNGTILAFGDSLTLGVGTTKAKSYPAVLAALSGLNVVNAGVSGETTDIGLARLAPELERTAPDLVILIEGGNDILRNRSHASIKQNLKKMIELAQSRGVPVVLIGVPMKNVFYDAAPLYEELADQYELVYNGSLIAELLHSPALKSDQIHFNEKGYRKMAESIYTLLENNGILP